MPAVPIVIAVATDAAVTGMVAEAVGAEILGSTLLADAATGAIAGGIGGGVSSGVMGGDIGKGFEQGFISGGIAAPIGKAVGGFAQGEGFGADASKAFGKGVGKAAGSLATGADLKTAATSGLISGGVDYLFGTPDKNAPTEEKLLSGIEKGFASSALTQAFNPSAMQSSSTTGGAGNAGIGGDRGIAPGSSALAQVLNVGDAGAPVMGGSEKEGGKKPGWNLESLRYMGGDSSGSKEA